MTRKYPPVYPEVLNYLRQEGETFNHLQPDSQEALTTAEWINKFPIASWGRIDWSKVPNSSCKTWTNDSELLSAFKRILVEKPSNVCLTTLVTEKLTREDQAYGICDRCSELHLRLDLTLFKHPLTKILNNFN